MERVTTWHTFLKVVVENILIQSEKCCQQLDSCNIFGTFGFKNVLAWPADEGKNALTG